MHVTLYLALAWIFATLTSSYTVPRFGVCHAPNRHTIRGLLQLRDQDIAARAPAHPVAQVTVIPMASVIMQINMEEPNGAPSQSFSLEAILEAQEARDFSRYHKLLSAASDLLLDDFAQLMLAATIIDEQDTRFFNVLIVSHWSQLQQQQTLDAVFKHFLRVDPLLIPALLKRLSITADDSHRISAAFLHVFLHGGVFVSQQMLGRLLFQGRVHWNTRMADGVPFVYHLVTCPHLPVYYYKDILRCEMVDVHASALSTHSNWIEGVCMIVNLPLCHYAWDNPVALQSIMERCERDGVSTCPTASQLVDLLTYTIAHPLHLAYRIMFK